MNTELENMKFTLAEENGDVEYEPILSFHSDITDKFYLVYTDNTNDSEGNLNTYASSYDPTNPDLILEPVETDQEWDIIEKNLNAVWGGNLDE
jgi:uncharacterized protein YrzB (UPF0473 family)